MTLPHPVLTALVPTIPASLLVSSFGPSDLLVFPQAYTHSCFGTFARYPCGLFSASIGVCPCGTSQGGLPSCPSALLSPPIYFLFVSRDTFSNTGYFLIVHTNSLMAGDFVWLLRAPSLVLEQHWAQRGQQDAKQVFVDKCPLRLLSF